jgi:hypothetical protein
MSFITERRAINAAAGIAEGLKARDAVKNAAGQEKAEPDFNTFKVAYDALVQVSTKLDNYYKAHSLLGRIVKWFDTHSIGGSFGKKSKIDALIAELGVFKGKEEAAQKAAEEAEKAEAARKAAEEAERAEAARKAAEEAEQAAEAARKAAEEAEKAEAARNAVRKAAEVKPNVDEEALLAEAEKQSLLEVERQAKMAADLKAKEDKDLKAAFEASKQPAGNGMERKLQEALDLQRAKVESDEEHRNKKAGE